MKNVQTISI